MLVSFNLVMALAAVPAAHLARRIGPGRAAAIGLAVFAGAGLACGASSELEHPDRRPLRAGAGRRAGGDRGAGAAAGDGRLRAPRGGVWATAGATGAALGPAVGGLLTELVSWQSIFLVQAPLAIAAGGAAARRRPARGLDRDRLRRAAPHRPTAPLANLALALVSAAIAAALFLLVLLLIEGWRLSPIGAAIVVSVMPLAALLGARLGPRSPAAPAPARRPARSSSPAASAAWRCCPRRRWR